MKYAIVESGGKQYKAVEGGTIEVDRLPVETGTNVKLEQVLLLADGETVTVGKPVVKDSPVWARVLAHFKGEKVTIFNYSPKKRIRVKTGHRQNYTRLLVQQIGGLELVVKESEPKAEEVEEAGEVLAVDVKTEKVNKSEPKAKTEPKPAAKASPPKGKAEPKKAESKKPVAKKPATTKTAPAKPSSTKKPTKTAAKKSESK
jgi:large subunit ribosomal protein L21